MKLRTPLRVFLLACLAGIAGTHLIAQRSVPSSLRSFDPSGWTVPDRIQAVENGLISTPIIIAGQPVHRFSLSDAMKRNNVPALSIAVVDNYKLSWAKGYGVTDITTRTPVTPETLFSAGGITKTVTAVTVLRLVQEGKLNLDADVNSILTSWKIPPDQFTEGHPVTLRELLSHSSGFDAHYPDDFDPRGKIPTLLEMLRGEPPSTFRPVHIQFQPGTSFDYSSEAFLVVQQALEDAMHEPFPEIVKQEVLDPAGMTHSTFDQPTASKPDPDRATGYIGGPDGQLQPRIVAFAELGSSGLWTTPSDLARLLINLQQSGQPGSLLSASMYLQMLKPVVNNVGLGIFLGGKGDDLYMRVRGSDGRPNDPFVAWMTGFVHAGQGAVIMANCPNAFTVGFSLLRSVALQYGWRDYVPTKHVIAVNPKIYALYVGKYRLGLNVVTISTDGKTLFGQMDTSPEVPLYPLSNGSFFVNVDLLHEVSIVFMHKPNEPAQEIDLHYPYDSYRAPRIQ